MLVLFDVDGTLLHGSADTHVRAFADALRVLTGHPDPFVRAPDGFWCGGTSLSGLIDAEIVRLCLGQARYPDSATAAMLAETVRAYRARIDAGDPPGTPVPGVAAVLDALRSRGAACGLLTGNARQVASVKLAACGLVDRFVVGGFGDEGMRRRDLFAGALTEAARLGLDRPRLCYVGDTPLDVAAAHQAGVAMVAVATGRFDRRALEAAGADVVLDDYAATAAVCDLLLDHARPVSSTGR